MKIRNKIMKKMFSTALIAVTTAVMTGCGVSVGELEEAPQEVEEESIVFSDKTLETRLIDNKVLYEDDDETSVVTMYLTVTKGNSSESTDHTWSEVNDHSVFYYDELGIDRYGVNGLLQVGDENGPVEGELGYERQTPNCIVTIRGQTSSRAKQKNYKIKIKDSSGDWRGQTVINLNKHQSDGLRFRNKLMYDLIKEVDDLVAMRTQFVHLYVKDLTEGNDAEFEDYGLYTQVEQANKKFLKAHGLDKEGHLYKLNNIFEFYKYDEIKMVNDVGYDAMAFRYYLKTKGDTNNGKLINMLKDVTIDRIKLDLNFLASSGDQKKSRLIISSIIKMFISLNVNMIAEGVETKEQADFLLSEGCSQMQGYYFYKPMPVEDFSKLILNSKK